MANLCLSATLRNTKAGPCDVVLGAFAYFIPTNKELTAEELETSDSLRTALAAAAELGRSATGKVFVFPKFSDATDNTGEAPKETLGDGRIQTGVEPAPSYTNEAPIGFCQAQAMRSFNGYSGKGYIVDSNGLFLFVNKSDGGGKGFQVQEIFVGAPRPGAYTGKRVVLINIAFANADEFNNMSAVRLDGWSPADLPTQEDVQLYEADVAAAYVFTIGGKIKCSNEEIYDAYSDVLDDPSLWVATRLDTNVEVTISGVVKDPGNKAWDFTLSSSPTIATDTKIKFELDLAALKTAGITTLESLAVTATKVA